jgi:hypothetical protein
LLQDAPHVETVSVINSQMSNNHWLYCCKSTSPPATVSQIMKSRLTQEVQSTAVPLISALCCTVQ